MSANNQIVIDVKTFKVYEDICVDNLFRREDAPIIGIGEDLVEAIKIAQKFIKENIVEYGIRFI